MGCNTSQEPSAAIENGEANAEILADEMTRETIQIENGNIKGKIPEIENIKNEMEIRKAAGITLKPPAEELIVNGHNEPEINGIELDGTTDEVEAATKIQAVFRGHKVRATMKQGDANTTTKTTTTTKDTPITPSNDPSREELEAEFDPNDKDLCNAAVRIQSTFRGHMARKVPSGTETIPHDELQELTKKVAEELDIDMDDPELHKAASKIQASFRGHKARRSDDDQDNEAK